MEAGSISRRSDAQKSFLPVLWRSNGHFFLIYPALQDHCSPDILRLLGKATDTVNQRPGFPPSRLMSQSLGYIVRYLHFSSQPWKLLLCLLLRCRFLMVISETSYRHIWGPAPQSLLLVDMVQDLSYLWKHLDVFTTIRWHFKLYCQ